MPIQQITSTELQNNSVENYFSSQGFSMGMRNRIINGNMAIDQRNAGASVSSGGSVVFSVDRWWFGSNGAATTAQRIAGSGSTQYRMQITGASSVTSVLFGQRIESSNSYDLAGSTVTVSFDMANSLLTSLTWGLSYANSSDGFGSYASPTTTLISSGIININNTITRYSFQVNIPADATTGLQLIFYVGAQTSGTWTIGNVQLEKGSVATPFEYRPYGTELALCQRYYFRNSSSANNNPFCNGYVPSTAQINFYLQYPQIMRISPTMSSSGSGNFWCQVGGSTFAPTSLAFQAISQWGCIPYCGVTGAIVGYAALLVQQTGTAWIDGSAEL